MEGSRMLIALLALLGYREPPSPRPTDKSEHVLHIFTFLLFIIYYFLTLRSIYSDSGLTNLSFFCWFVSMTITATDNLKRILFGMKRYKELTAESNISKHKRYVFHNGFYMFILAAEALSAISVFVIHMAEFKCDLVSLEQKLMSVSTVFFMAQSLVHAMVDTLNLDDIEEI